MSWRDRYKTLRVEDNKLDSDTFKILIATDIHLGYEEDDLVRGADSLDAFEEVLMLASQEQVDMILLGGDLFHENKPSRETLNKCMSLIRQYCFGTRNLDIFHPLFPNSKEELLNFEDPNLNISIPIFTIHGNHDDPTGPGNLSVINLLSTTGLINYFGKSEQVDEILVEPLVLQKGDTRIALYGVGAVRNERLFRTFSQNKVKFLKTQEEMFNIMILHQNRVKHGEKSYIKPEFIPTFMDLVFWGHEHDNRILPQEVSVGTDRLMITQPGSTVATSLSEGEAGDKNVGLLYIKGKMFNIEPRTLLSIRPFPSPPELSLQDKMLEFDDLGISEYISAKVDDLLEQVKVNYPDNPKLPLLRIKVNVPPSFNANKIRRVFLNKYSKLVANPGEVILFSKKTKRKEKFKDGLEDSTYQVPEDPYITAEDSIIDLFRNSARDNELDLITTSSISLVLEQFVVKEETKAVGRFASETLVNSLEIFKTQYESRPGLGAEELDLSHVKQELENIAQDPNALHTTLLSSDSDSELYSGVHDDTTDLLSESIGISQSQMSPTSSLRSSLPSQRRGSPRVQLHSRGGQRQTFPDAAAAKPQKRNRSSRSDLTGSSEAGVSSRGRGAAASKRGPKRRRI